MLDTMRRIGAVGCAFGIQRNAGNVKNTFGAINEPRQGR